MSGTGSVAIGAVAGLGGAILVSVASAFGRRDLVLDALPWLLLIGGPIAALDAWGAARHRGRPREAWARALVILALSIAIAAAAVITRR